MTTLQRLKHRATLAVLTGMIMSCSSVPVDNSVEVLPDIAISNGHIGESTKVTPSPSDIPRATGLTLTPPAPELEKDLFTIVVTDVPARKILFALARDARVNIDVHPTIEGNVTLNAIDQSITQILDRLAKQIAVRYRIENDLITVVPDTPYLETYNINYLNMSRSSGSNVSIATEVSSTGAGAGSEGSGEANVSNTRIANTSNNFFWDSLLDNLQAILRGGDSNFNPGTTESSAGNDDAQNDGMSIIANRESGIVSVRASRKQHLEIKKYIDSVQEHAQRQVVIEATIAEVTLNDRYQAGIDWEKIGTGSDLNLTQAVTGSNLGQAPLFSLNYTDIENGAVRLSTTLKMLSQFGKTKVLSSPKLMVLNNQTALLKVVENKIYFTTTVDREVQNDGPDITTFETEVHTLPVGFVMSVTPQISEDDFVTINARPTVSRILGFALDPNPELARVNVESLIPEIQVREVESVLRIANGDVGIIGGLMQDFDERENDGVPGLAKIPYLGNLFKYRSDNRSKTELVIFIRPIIVRKASTDSDLAQFREYLAHADNSNQAQGK